MKLHHFLENGGNWKSYSKRNKLDTGNNPHIFSHLWELKFFVKYICLPIYMYAYIHNTYMGHTYIYIHKSRQAAEKGD